jgi:hypothetical protein
MDSSGSTKKLSRTIKVFFWLCLLFPSFLLSEPYIAIRTGLKCSSCHINRTGGGQRTRMGAGYGTQDLPWKKINLQERNIPSYWSLHDDLVALGGDFRFLNDTTFVEDDTANTFQTDKVDLYLTFQLLPDRLTLYSDTSLAPGGTREREIAAIIDISPGRSWVKAGKFVLPYGLRLEDDQAFIRQFTGFTFNNPDLGVEIGYEPSHWSLVASATNGTAGSVDNNTDKQIVGSAAYVHQNFRVGVSGSFNKGEAAETNSAALWGGFHLGPAVLLGEFDFVHDEPDATTKRDQIITYAEIDYLITQGWNIKAAYEYYDPDTSIDENQRDRVLIGVEPFIIPFLQLGVYYRFNQSIPQNKLQNADELTFRLHIYF